MKFLVIFFITLKFKYFKPDILFMKNKLLLLILSIFLLSPLYPQSRELFRVNEHADIKTSLDVKTQYLLSAYVSRVVDGDTIIIIVFFVQKIIAFFLVPC